MRPLETAGRKRVLMKPHRHDHRRRRLVIVIVVIVIVVIIIIMTVVNIANRSCAKTNPNAPGGHHPTWCPTAPTSRPACTWRSSPAAATRAVRQSVACGTQRKRSRNARETLEKRLRYGWGHSTSPAGVTSDRRRRRRGAGRRTRRRRSRRRCSAAGPRLGRPRQIPR